jgi:hypothetical protein
MEENKPTLAELAAKWGKEFGAKIEYFESPDRETDENIRTALDTKAEQIRPAELLLRQTTAVLLLVAFAGDEDADGNIVPKLFELSESASAEYRAQSKASSSFGDAFDAGLIQ